MAFFLLFSDAVFNAPIVRLSENVLLYYTSCFGFLAQQGPFVSTWSGVFCCYVDSTWLLPTLTHTVPLVCPPIYSFPVFLLTPSLSNGSATHQKVTNDNQKRKLVSKKKLLRPKETLKEQKRERERERASSWDDGDWRCHSKLPEKPVVRSSLGCLDVEPATSSSEQQNESNICLRAIVTKRKTTKGRKTSNCFKKRKRKKNNWKLKTKQETKPRRRRRRREGEREKRKTFLGYNKNCHR